MVTARSAKVVFTLYSQFFKAVFKFPGYDMDILKGMSPRRGARIFFIFIFFSPLLYKASPFPWEFFGGGLALF